MLRREQDPDDGRAFVWRDDGLHRLGEHGDVDLGDPTDPDDLDDEAVSEVVDQPDRYAFTFALDGDGPTGETSTAGTEPEPGAPVLTDGGDTSDGDGPPPDGETARRSG